jgi:signal transduction histidine kinase
MEPDPIALPVAAADMSYRSIKRVLGENSLERKCRILFGFCMLVLIGGSFWGVMRLTENFIREETRKKAKEMLVTHLLKVHLASTPTTGEPQKQPEFMKGITKRFSRFNARIDAIALDNKIQRNDIATRLPGDAVELRRVRELVATFQRTQIREHFREYQPASDEILDATVQARMQDFGDVVFEEENDDSFLESANIPEKYVDRFAPDDRYQFYQPIIFTSMCMGCHAPATYDAETEQWSILPTENVEGFGSSVQPLPPMYVIRLTLSHESANEGINQSRAILLATAIITAFLSTAALYAIIRYVIVKPLKHLQAVIKEVSGGNMDVRSDLNTGDEFEELSKALNRMLRHLADSQAELEAVNVDLDRKVDEQAQLTMKLYETNQIKSDFLANMSHELRTPLNSIIGFSEVLAEINSLSEKQRGYARNIRNSGHVLLDLINDILDLAKLEAGKTEVKPQDFSITSLVEDLGEMIRPLAVKKNIKVQTRVDDDIPTLHQDQGKVRQILTNLLSNAVKFTPEGGRINTDVSLDGDDVVLRVSDTGVGIAEPDRTIIFEKFRQAPSTIGVDSLTRKHSGTGLGLSIVRELCILLGGTIEVESEIGKGSVFTVVLPCRYEKIPGMQSALSEQLDELNKAQRVDMSRAANAPLPADSFVHGAGESGSSAAADNAVTRNPA